MMPLSVSSFSQLHDYVDANEYGGLCDPAQRGHWVDHIDSVNKMQDELDCWLASGEARTEKIAMWLHAEFGMSAFAWKELDEEQGKEPWRQRARQLQRDLLPGIEFGVV